MGHYHVLIGTQGGYMPDENLTCYTLDQARSVAAEEILNARDQEFRVRTVQSGSLWTIAEKDPSPHSLGNYIEIAPCDAPDCLCSDCGEREAGPSGQCDDCYGGGES
jgi:hypothetical protein